MASRDEEHKILSSDQFDQWKANGMAEEFVDEGDRLFRWTEKALEEYKYATLSTVASFVRGRPIYPIEADRTRIEPLIRADWEKDGFTKDGFLLIDEA